MKIKVRASVTMIGLNAGQEAEIDLTPTVVDLIRAGWLKAQKPRAT